jgi:hypothetical protein
LFLASSFVTSPHGITTSRVTSPHGRVTSPHGTTRNGLWASPECVTSPHGISKGEPQRLDRPFRPGLISRVDGQCDRENRTVRAARLRLGRSAALGGGLRLWSCSKQAPRCRARRSRRAQPRSDGVLVRGGCLHRSSLSVSLVLLQQNEMEPVVFVAMGMSNSFPDRLPPVLRLWHVVPLRGGRSGRSERSTTFIREQLAGDRCSEACLGTFKRTIRVGCRRRYRTKNNLILCSDADFGIAVQWSAAAGAEHLLAARARHRRTGGRCSR